MTRTEGISVGVIRMLSQLVGFSPVERDSYGRYICRSDSYRLCICRNNDSQSRNEQSSAVQLEE